MADSTMCSPMATKNSPTRRPEDYGAGVGWRDRGNAPKLQSWDLWDSVGRPKFIAAPMVEGSELPFRALCRRYGAELCYTPMFHSLNFSTDPKFRKQQFSTNKQDTPLFVQFCANDPEVLLEAARYVEGQCDAVDINFGCPQNIAKRGHYGSFLMEDQKLIFDLIRTLHTHLNIPVTAKIRCFTDIQHTIEYARMVEEAGAQIVCVHGRTREMKGVDTGLADWSKIRAVKEALSVPVIANGNILSYADIEPCLEATKCDGVMSAEGILWDPRLFRNPAQPLWSARQYSLGGAYRKHGLDLAEEYLQLCRECNYNSYSCVKGHVFKLAQHSLEAHTHIRDVLSNQVPPKNPIPFLSDLLGKLRGLEEAELAGEYACVRKTLEMTRPNRPPAELCDQTETAADSIGAMFGEGEGCW